MYALDVAGVITDRPSYFTDASLGFWNGSLPFISVCIFPSFCHFLSFCLLLKESKMSFVSRNGVLNVLIGEIDLRKFCLLK